MPFFILVVFETIAITLWLTLDNIFFLFNFTYIGSCVSMGFLLYLRKVKYARMMVQFTVGLYLLFYLGIISHENMMIEGFWYYLFLGVFEAAVIHYAVAKIFGPLLFGRGWCGYACWTAMVLDLLPYKRPQQPRRKIGFIRYIAFIVSLIFVLVLFLLKVPNIEGLMFWSFIVGNVFYYAIGIFLAFTLKDNRAFCKYICPITIFLKPASYYSVLRVKVEADKCISCGKCKKVCPMNVDMTNNSRKRKNATECILCFNCVEECPVKALHT
nr:4Fe-4S dicluster domain-containing protein [Aminipila sp.]